MNDTNPTTKRRYLDVLLGVFVAVGIALLGALVFLLGKERRMFDSSAYVRAEYPNVAGLAVGAQVLLAGVNVGHVSEITFPQLNKAGGEGPGRVTVIMRISKKMMPWIRRDSVARVDSKGLLGDRIINISLGSSAYAPVPDGGALQSQPPLDFNEALVQTKKILDNVTSSVVSARKLLDGFVREGGDKALAQATKNIKNIAYEIEHGQGLLHQIVYDKKSAEEFKRSVTNLNDAVFKIRDILGHANNMLAEVETGKGLIHTLIYDEKGAKTIHSAEKMFKETAQLLSDIRESNGILHTLIYDEGERGQFISNLNSATDSLNQIMSRLKEGEGTVGRLLIDPTIYEDLKVILGQVKRNEILKTLIRYTISHRGEDSPEPARSVDVK